MVNADNAQAFNSELAWDTSSVTAMSFTFVWANAFNSELNWDTSSVTGFADFNRASRFNGDLSRWDMSKAVNLNEMFQGVSAYARSDVLNWDVAAVTDFTDMFEGTLLAEDACFQHLTGQHFGATFGNSRVPCGCVSVRRKVPGMA